MSAPKLETIYLPSVLEKHHRDMNGKVVAITGTTTGTGFVAALELAKKGAVVVLLNRKSVRVPKMMESLTKAVPQGKFDPIECDLQDFASVRKASDAIKAKYKAIDVLINNAGIMAMPQEYTKDGYDIQMQTNVLSHFLLTKELFPLIKAASEGRVVNHSSAARLGPDLEQKYFEKNADTGGNGTVEEAMAFTGPKWARYHMTKLANAVFTYALKDRLEKAGITSILSLLAHPGLSDTALTDKPSSTGGMMDGDKLSSFVNTGQTAEDGAAGILRAALSPEVKSGEFFGPGGPNGDDWKKGYPDVLTPEPLLYSAKNEKVFWEGCEKAVGTFDLSA